MWNAPHKSDPCAQQGCNAVIITMPSLSNESGDGGKRSLLVCCGVSLRAYGLIVAARHGLGSDGEESIGYGRERTMDDRKRIRSVAALQNF